MQALTLAAAVGLWAVIHSWLATIRMKEFARRKLGNAGARVYRLFYNVFSALSLIPILLLWRNTPDRVLYSAAAPWSYLMLGGQAACLVLLFMAFLQTGPLAFVGIPQLLGEKASAGLTTTGFYGLVRHPLYLFGLILLWMAPSMSVNQLTVNLVLTIYLFVGAILEERRLVMEFGAVYESYRTNTPMIIPFTRRGAQRQEKRSKP
jgi:protein-S-isoprenylcysteine O-methyltransferase Ste14